jgi:hypothetical protein
MKLNVYEYIERKYITFNFCQINYRITGYSRKFLFKKYKHFHIFVENYNYKLMILFLKVNMLNYQLGYNFIFIIKKMGKLQEEIYSRYQKKSSLKNDIFNHLYFVFGRKFRGKRIHEFKSKLFIVDIIMAGCVLIGSIFAIIGLECNIYFNQMTEGDKHFFQIQFDENNTCTLVSRSIVTVTTILILITITFQYIYYETILKMKLKIRSNQSWKDCERVWWYFFEICLNVVHTPPGLNASIPVAQRKGDPVDVNLDVILTVLLLFFRSYHCVRWIAFHTRWYSHTIEKLCLQCRTPFNFLFCIKAEFKDNPLRMVLFALSLSVFIFGYSLRCVEMFYMTKDNNLNWEPIWNGIWCVIITMLTVGYGDFYPISILGRFIVVIACFWGNFLTSLMVSALNVSVELNSRELNVYENLKAAKFEISYGITATKYIQACLRYYWLERNGNEDRRDKHYLRKKCQLFKDLKKYSEEFRKLRNRRNEMVDHALVDFSLSKLDENINLEMDYIKSQLHMIDEVKSLVEEYHNNQILIKDKTVTLFNCMEDLNSFLNESP